MTLLNFSTRTTRAMRRLVLPATMGLLCGCQIFSPGFDTLLQLAQLDNSNTDLETEVSIVQPRTAVTAALGAPTIIQWADIAKVSGSTVRVTAQRQDALQADIGDPLQLLGDGTVGSGRDAAADGDGDIFNWDITGVRIGDYVITITIESPEGESKSVVSRDDARGIAGVITVTTALPTPTLSFTNPGAADVTATAPTAVNLTWTDNGATNADAILTLGLDTDATHDDGNEITLLRNEPLSTDGNNGTFNFAYVDADGNAVPAGTYRVFARIDDNAHDIVTVEATGQLVVVP